MNAIEIAPVGTALRTDETETVPTGNAGHFPVLLMETPPAGDACLAPSMSQWCLPPLRQHAGRSFCDGTSIVGLMSEKHISARSKTEQRRRKVLT